MKPKDLKFPFAFKDRKPYLKDMLLCVPEHYFEHEAFTMPSWSDIFDNDHHISVEFCSGNGEWIFTQALENPQKNWVAVELKFDRVRKIYAKAHNAGITNLLIVCGEALTFSKYYIKTSSVNEVYINFPDPWPKDRHAKHRLIKAPFPRELARITNSVLLVTDDPIYFAQMNAEMSPFWNCDISYNEEYGPSFFKRLWQDMGKTIHFLSAKREWRHLDCTYESDLNWPDSLHTEWKLDCGLESPDFPFNDELIFSSLSQALTHFSKKYPAQKVCLYEGPLQSAPAFGEYLQLLASKLVDETEVYALFDANNSKAKRAVLLSPERFGYIHTSLQESNEDKGVLLPLDELVTDKLIAHIDEAYQDHRIIPERYLTEMWDNLSELNAFEGLISEQGERKLQGFSAALGTVNRINLE